MTIFRRYLADLLPKVPTVLRRVAPVTLDDDDLTETSGNVINLTYACLCQFLDAAGEALREQAEESWPLDTASSWVLDLHWGPYHNMQRGGLSDADFRTYIHAFRMLMRSWGSPDQALRIFALLLPTANLSFTPWYPKAWEIVITGVDMVTAAPAVLFMTKNPSPEGGGFSVCGDNGWATIVDPEAFNYSSVYGVIGVDYLVTGWFGSEYGPGGGVQAGYAHVNPI